MYNIKPNEQNNITEPCELIITTKNVYYLRIMYKTVQHLDAMGTLVF